MWRIYDYRGVGKAVVHEVEYEGNHGGMRTLTCSISSPMPIAWEVTDNISYRGENFYLRHIPQAKKQARVLTHEEAFVYDNVVFYSAIDELASCDFLDVVKEDNNIHYTSLPNFSFYCETIYDIADRLQANLDRLYTGSEKWTIQVSTDATAKVDIKPQALSFSSEKCSQVLERIYNDLGVTYEHTNRTIVFGAKPIMMPYEFKYGKGKGLKSIEQSGADGNALVTRARVYGSTRNLPNRYYNKLYKNSKTGAVMYFKTDEDKPKDFETYWKPLISETMYVPNLMLPMFRENGKDAYIDAPGAIAKYGLREGTKFFDSNNGEDEEIYPTIENMTADRLEELGYTPELHDGDNGKLDELLYVDDVPFSGVMPEGGSLPSSESHFVVYLKDIGFDINDYLVGTPKISFRSGALAGREFDIVKCEQTALINKTYKLTCKRVEDTSIQLVFPYKDYKPSAGDKFVLLEIDMPEIYIKVAEVRLKEEGEKWLELNSNPIYTYTPEIDSINILRNPQIAENLKEGRTFIFADEDLGISKAIRISNLKIKDNGFAPEYEITLSDKHTVSLAEKVTQSVVNMIGSNNASTENIKALIEAYGNNLFLSKKKRDTADQVIRFTLGLEVGENKANINANGDAEVESLTSRSRVKASEVVADNIHTTDYAQGALLGTGGAIYQLEGATYAEFDYLTARKGATFAELIIQEYRSIGGALVISQANGEIENIYDYGNVYNVWIKDDDKSDSLFVNKDLVRCQYWDRAKNKLVYYWVPVSVSEDSQGRYVLTIYKKDMNGVVPQVGDKLVQMGNTTDTSRQGCILLTTENSLPRMAILDGIDEPKIYNTEDKTNYKGIYGSLENFVDPYTGKKLSGYGMWGENVYLHGDLVMSSTKTTISSELANLNNDLTLTKALIDEDIREINNRLDGVVTNWFGGGVPTLDNHPAEQWTTEQEKMNHIGDTYTNTETTGDNAGRSWRFIQDNGEFKWILIADSDATKALEWASKAQSTADGKRRVFTSTPYVPYDKGDLWVKQEGEKTTLYYSTANKAVGYSFAESDWLIGATDDTAIKDLQIGGTNLLVGTNQGVNNWLLSTSLDKGKYSMLGIDKNGAKGIQVVKRTTEESSWGEVLMFPLRPQFITKDKTYHISFDLMQSVNQEVGMTINLFLTTQNGSINNALNNIIKVKSINVNGVWQHHDYEFTAIRSGSETSGQFVYFGITKQNNPDGWVDLAIVNLKLEEGNKATTWSPSPEDMQDEYDRLAELANNAQITADNAQSLADEAKSNAYLAQSSANAAKERLDAWAEDGVISPNEKQGLKDELTRIEGDYKDIIDRFDRASLDSPSGYIEAYNAYTDMLSYLINESAISGKETTDIPEDFAEIQENYYQQKVNAYYDLYDSSLTSAENAQSTADTIAQTTATLTQDIININNRLDGVVENWFYKGYPTPQNAPAIEWTNAQEKYNHIGDTFTSIDENGDYAGKSWRWIGVTAEPSFEIDFTTGSINGVTYYFYWQTIADSDAIKALQQAKNAQDTADGKRRVFVAQPTTPYDEGDLWVKTENNGVTTIYYCVTPKADGGVFSNDDWQLAATDNSALQAFIDGNFKGEISNLKAQIDKKAETWYQSTDPSSQWHTDDLKNLHIGDMWYNTNNNTTHRWNGSLWEEQNIPKSVFDTIDGKAQIFVTTPTPPYNIGDLWVQGDSGDILRCKAGRSSGNYNPNDWEKASKYTDDSAANEVLSQLNAYKTTMITDLDAIKSQVDSKVESWFGSYVPSLDNAPANGWNTNELKESHIGDTFTNTQEFVNSTTTPNAGKSWRWLKKDGTYGWDIITDYYAQKALEDASNAQDTADGKRRVFVETPTTPYDEGDLWVQGEGGDIMRCKYSRSSGSYSSSDWVKASKYTDDTALNDYKEVVSKEFAATDGKFTSMQTKIAEQDGKIEANTSLIQQTADNISLTIKGLTWDNQNLLLNSAKVINDRNYLLGSYDLGDFKPINGSRVTLSFSGYLGNGHGMFRIYNSGWQTEITTLNVSDYNMTTQRYEKTFDWVIGNTENTYINIFQADINGNKITDYSDASIHASKIYNIKLEFSSKATSWTPAPEDTNQALKDTGIDIKSKKITVTADNFQVQNNEGNATLAVDENGNLVTNTLRTISSSNAKTITINENNDRMQKFYYPNTNQTQLEIGWDGKSLMRYYDENGVMLWQLGDQKGFMDSDYIEWTAVGLHDTELDIDIDYIEGQLSRFKTVGDVELDTYYQHNVVNTSPKIYKIKDENSEPINGWFTSYISWTGKDGSEDPILKRGFRHYTNGLIDWSEFIAWDPRPEGDIWIIK